MTGSEAALELRHVLRRDPRIDFFGVRDVVKLSCRFYLIFLICSN
jgi:hypothetical protein